MVLKEMPVMLETLVILGLMGAVALVGVGVLVVPVMLEIEVVLAMLELEGLVEMGDLLEVAAMPEIQVTQDLWEGPVVVAVVVYHVLKEIIFKLQTVVLEKEEQDIAVGPLVAA